MKKALSLIVYTFAVLVLAVSLGLLFNLDKDYKKITNYQQKEKIEKLDSISLAKKQLIQQINK
jgi:predicted histidine transporter YuiF (NhaC family)